MAQEFTDSHATEGESPISTELQEVPHHSPATPIRAMMRERARISPDCFIFRAQTLFRDSKEKLFDPKVVSIGPLHHGKEKLQTMEKRKLDYLEELLARTSVSVETFIVKIQGWENAIRNCYAEIFEFISSEDFVMMILLDSCFVIEILWMMYYRVDDRLVHMYRFDIQMDMISVENQLPFFVLEGVYNLAFPDSIGAENCFLNLCLEFVAVLCTGYRGLSMERMSQQPQSEIKHLLDLLRTFMKPSISRESPGYFPSVMSTPKLTELEEAGLVIKPRLDYSSGLDICYKKGVLEIPRIRITDISEYLLVNLTAFEYCIYFDESYVSDYIHFMNSLIDTNKDVDILIRNGVLEISGSSNSRRVAILFNSIGRDLDAENYFYYGTQEKVNAYCRNPYRRWRAALRSGSLLILRDISRLR